MRQPPVDVAKDISRHKCMCCAGRAGSAMTSASSARSSNHQSNVGYFVLGHKNCGNTTASLSWHLHVRDAVFRRARIQLYRSRENPRAFMEQKPVPTEALARPNAVFDSAQSVRMTTVSPCSLNSSPSASPAILFISKINTPQTLQKHRRPALSARW